MTRRLGRCVSTAVLVLGVAACTTGAPDTAAAHGAADAHGTDAAIATPTDPPSPPGLGALVAVPVAGFTGPGGEPFEVTSRTAGSDAVLYRQIGMRTFALPLRPPAPLRQYPCATCHQGTRASARPGESRHENIRPEHPRLAEGACPTCHVLGAVERLSLAGGAATTLDHAYRLCAQCHAFQVRDWAAGAHGKRLMAWGGRRVVMSCADCHDPHRPGLEPRLPFPGPRIRRTAGGGP